MDPSTETLPASRPRRRIGSWIWMLVVFICLLTIVFLRVQGGLIDFAAANIATWILAVVVVVALVERVYFWRDVHWLVRWVPIAAVALAVLACFLLLRVDRISGRLAPRFVWRWAPRPDRLLGEPVVEGTGPVDLATTTPQDFCQFLGPNRDVRVTGVKLDRDWVARPPRVVWRQPIGAGWSGFSAVNGFAVTMEQRGEDELVSCYEVESGRLRWTHAAQARYETVSGGVGPRCTPTIDQGRVYALGPTGILRCLDGRDGSLVWSDNILAHYDVTPEQDLGAVAWGRSASPLIVDNLVIVPLGGPKGGPYASLAAFDKETGELVWTGGRSQVSYASPSLAELCGVRQALIVNEDSVSGHRLDDGAELWSWPWRGGSTGSATVSQAVPVSDNQVLLSKDYGVGSALLQLSLTAGGQWEVASLWHQRNLLKTKFTNVAVRDGCAYGLSDGILECVDIQSGTRRWKDRRGDYGPGQILMVDDLILVQAEAGDVVLVEANPNELVELGRFPALSDQTWNNLCLYGRYLLVRNSVEAACYRVELSTEP